MTTDPAGNIWVVVCPVEVITDIDPGFDGCMLIRGGHAGTQRWCAVVANHMKVERGVIVGI